MLSRSAREATFVFPEGHALPEQTALAFKEWLDKENVSILGCDLGVRSDLAAVRGVFAIKDLPIGEVVVSVPDGSVLMPHTCSIGNNLEAAGLCNSPGAPDNEALGLVVAVMAEKCLGMHSRWADYLGFLPKIISTLPIYWTSQELQPLRHTALVEKLAGKWEVLGCHIEAPTQGSPVKPRRDISCTCGPQQLCVATPSPWGKTAFKLWCRCGIC
ncbi:hypothetical protein WJX79_001169 [Trebouxia sp. C0005]